MVALPIAVLQSGMVCGVGLSAPAACAAIRCAIDNFQQTHFIDSGGEWIIGSSVRLEKPFRGRAKLIKMLTMAVRECLEGIKDAESGSLPLLLCVAERDRAGRIDGLEEVLFGGLQDELGYRFHPTRSSFFPEGRVSAAIALAEARKLIHDQRVPQVLIAASDSLLTGPALAAFEERDRLLTSQNSNGFVPGEAASAILIGPPLISATHQLLCTGLGYAVERTTVDAEEPLRADGLAQAIKAALADAGCDMGTLDFRITDNSGEQYYFKEAALALSRTLRKRKDHFHIWHPADCIGEVGAAIGPIMLAVALAGNRKDYSYGLNALCHLGSDSGRRAAAILRYQSGGAG
jgi:3-oxoacyl-[acyl-carrier-protein] synthase-1